MRNMYVSVRAKMFLFFSILERLPGFPLQATPSRSSLVQPTGASKEEPPCTDVGCQDYLCYTFSTFLMKRTRLFANFGLLRLIYSNQVSNKHHSLSRSLRLAVERRDNKAVVMKNFIGTFNLRVRD